MILILFTIICFGASIIGAICGIGGGVIIKPVLDTFGVLDVATISFLSGCTVLSMTTYSVIKSKISGNSSINQKTAFPLAVGAAIGGLIGKWLFSFISSLYENKNRIGAIQAICLMVITVGTLVYTLLKERIDTHRIKSALVCGVIGVALGIMSSFLGIGGGPINLVVLYFFFSMTTKVAAENSLYIIFFSQLASLLASIFTNKVPDFEWITLIMMALGGIGGGIAGRALNKHISEKTVEKLFITLMVVIIFINVYNIWKFLR